MLRILDKLLLFAMCSCLIFQLEGDYRRVVIFIIGLMVAALTLYIENRKVIGALLIAMAVLCLIEPGFTFLLPLVFFDSFWFGLWWGWGMGFAVLFFYALPVYQPWMTAIWLFLSLAAVLLAHQTGNGAKAESDSAPGYQHGVKLCDAGEEPQAFRGTGYRNLYGNAKGAEPDCKRNP